MRSLLLILPILFILISCDQEKPVIQLYIDQSTDQSTFAAAKAAEMLGEVELLQSEGLPEKGIIVYSDKQSPGIEDPFNGAYPETELEGYVLARSFTDPDRLYVLANDPKGAMYGILDVAEQLSFGLTLEQIETRKVIPSLRHRFIKFNLPWSSYRKGQSLSIHEETCKDTSYWKEFLDMMALNRFNTLTLWNLHPFTTMIRPEKYPEASDLSDSEMEEWYLFWTTLFRMARVRGIDTYIVNWNIFTSQAFAEAHQLNEYLRAGDFYGNAENSELIEDYTRECVRQVIDDYPDLTGIGITLGERMGGMTSEERRDWMDRTVIEGMRQAGRKVKLLYRAPLSAGLSSRGTTSKSTEVITRAYLDTLTAASETVISFKYNWSHGHSSDQLFIVHGGELTDTYWNPVPENYSMLWTIRNEDFFMSRWCNPGFTRAFLKNNMTSYTTGCILGSECYIPAADYFSKNPPAMPFEYAFQRQWLWYSVWGRLLYDRDTPDDLFSQQIARKFGTSSGADLFELWVTASYYYHHFNSFIKGTWDATNYAEAFTILKRDSTASYSSTILTMELMGFRPVLDTNRYRSIADFILKKGESKEGLIDPPELATILKANGLKILSGVSEIRDLGMVSSDLEVELNDLELLANLQLFFARRIEATLLLAAHLLAGEEADYSSIDSHLSASIKCWERIIQLKEKYHKETIPYVFNESLNYRDYLAVLEDEYANYRDLKEFWNHDLR